MAEEITVRPVLIAVDTNVLIDQALGDEDVLDALRVIRERIPKAQFVVPRTVIEELTAGMVDKEDDEIRDACGHALRCLIDWGYQPMDVVPVGRGIVEVISKALRSKEIIPDEEENDASIIAESALIGCRLLLSSDHHLIAAQANPKFLPVLESADVEPLVIGRPRTIASKYDRRR